MIQAVLQPPSEADQLAIIERAANRLARKNLPAFIDVDDLKQIGWMGVNNVVARLAAGRLTVNDDEHLQAIIGFAAKCAMRAVLKKKSVRSVLMSLDYAVGDDEAGDTVAALIAGDDASPDDAMDRRSRLTALIAALDPTTQRLLRLRYVDGLAPDRAALVLNMPASRAKKLHSFAMHHLRSQIDFSGENDG